jgi:hypothetical protein
MGFLARNRTTNSICANHIFALTLKLFRIITELRRNFLFERLILFFGNNETHKRLGYAHHSMDFFFHFTIITICINAIVPKIHLYRRLQTFSFK